MIMIKSNSRHRCGSQSLFLGERVAEGRVRVSKRLTSARAKFGRQHLTWPGSLTLALSHGERGPDKSRSARQRQSGFTLVEMLVAVTLVLLMMVMFAEVFQLAGASVTKQRVMADNDQNARTFVTIIRADLGKRSFRTLVPFVAGELATNTGPTFDKRGYFSISCNNLADGSDDVLQFTTDLQDDDELPYYGRAVPVPPTITLPTLLQNRNQPELDDGQIALNYAATSPAAEISFWMRGGKLYRRVMLLRKPIKGAGGVTDNEAQPNPSDGSTPADYYFQPPLAPVPYVGNFWNDFDFSAHRFPGAPAQYAIFHDRTTSLSNNPPAAGKLFYSLGETWHRFGHDHTRAPNSLNNGLPREFSASSSPNFFVGRFTQEETSNPAFLYPYLPSTVGNGNPMNAVGTTLSDTSPNDGVVDEFAGGSRAGVDLLLSHVHEFRVEVWDQRLNDFAPVGHNLPVAGNAATWGDYNINRRLNATYGSLGGAANVFDTWHPAFDRDMNGTLGNEPDRPPYRPVTIDPTGISGPMYINPSGASLWWMPNTNYQVGDIVFPRMEDLNGNGFLDAGEDGTNGFPANGTLDRRLTEDANGNNILDLGEDGTFGFPADGALNSAAPPFFPFGLNIWYRCTSSGRSGPWSNNEPPAKPPNWQGAGQWSLKANISPQGVRDEDYFGNANGALEPWEDLNGNGINDPLPNEPVWKPVTQIVPSGNVRPLRAIRITVRFEHPSSKQMRQVTIVHSL